MTSKLLPLHTISTTLKTEHFDLVVKWDIEMPRMNGFALYLEKFDRQKACRVARRIGNSP